MKLLRITRGGSPILNRSQWKLNNGTGTNQIATFADISGSNKRCIKFSDLPYGGKTYINAGESNRLVKYSNLRDQFIGVSVRIRFRGYALDYRVKITIGSNTKTFDDTVHQDPVISMEGPNGSEYSVFVTGGIKETSTSVMNVCAFELDSDSDPRFGTLNGSAYIHYTARAR